MQSIFQKYISGKCTDEEYRKILTYIQNPENNVVLNEWILEFWMQNNKTKSEIKPNPQLLDSIHHKIALREQKQKPVLRTYRFMLAAAAVLILVMISGSLLYFKSLEDNITFQKITTPFGAKTNLVLPDGTEVWLNSGSTFTYPVRFTGLREVELTGEAYFKVEKQKQPFVVNTQSGKVQVLGTQFNVKVYDNESFSTTLEEGAVVFINNSGQNATLEPGQQVIFDQKNFKIRNVETRLFTSWKDGQLIFREEPLKNIITQLERWYNVKIVLQDDRIKNLKFNGTIEMESFSEVLELIKVTTPIKYSFDRKTRVLTISAM